MDKSGIGALPLLSFLTTYEMRVMMEIRLVVDPVRMAWMLSRLMSLGEKPISECGYAGRLIDLRLRIFKCALHGT
jgi:hypothetical protein